MVGRGVYLRHISAHNMLYMDASIFIGGKIQKKVFERDAYHCRYCGGKLISQEFLRTFIKSLNSPLFSRGETNLSTHGIIHITWPVADHVIPWNKGGRTSLENLVSSCAPCNYGKDGYTIEQLGLADPFERSAKNSNWDGFSRKFKKKNCS